MFSPWSNASFSYSVRSIYAKELEYFCGKPRWREQKCYYHLKVYTVYCAWVYLNHTQF